MKFAVFALPSLVFVLGLAGTFGYGYSPYGYNTGYGGYNPYAVQAGAGGAAGGGSSNDIFGFGDDILFVLMPFLFIVMSLNNNQFG